MRRRSFVVAILLFLFAAAAIVLFLHSPIPQDPGYHRFVDQRVIAGIPHFGDVVTNIPFIIVGIAGLVFLRGRGRDGSAFPFLESRERRAYVIFFLGLVLTGFGSTWYHWDPDTGRLFWDRLPLTLVFMSLFTIVITERLSVRTGSRWLWPLLAIGASSVLYWHWTERAGNGDLRLYVLVQFYPMLAIPLVLIFFPTRYSHGGYFWGVIGTYGLAKGCELLDTQIYQATLWVTGHNLKHLAAALACGWILRMLQQRRPATPGE